jgi:hypothetical protein
MVDETDLVPDEDLNDEIDQISEDQVDENDGDQDEIPEDLAGAADGDGQETPGRQEGQVRQPTRAERRVEAALREAREAKADAQRLREEIAEARRAPAQPQETPAQRAERLSMMDPDQRIEYLLAERDQRTEARLAQAEFRAEDRADKAAFDSFCAADSRFGKFKDDVEDRLAQMRRNGTTAPRETILRYIIGDRALAKAPAATTRANNRAAGNRGAQAARPANARGDVPAQRSSGGDERAARAKRLENMEI